MRRECPFSRFPSTLKISLDPQGFPWEISPVSGMDFLIPPLFGCSTDTVLTAVGGGQNEVTIIQCSGFH